MTQQPMNDVELREYYTSYTLKNNLNLDYDKFVFLVRSIEEHHDIYHDLAAVEALENIENEIMHRACRNGVCED
jgi:ubiquinone biosynthesis protein Coq4